MSVFKVEELTPSSTRLYSVYYQVNCDESAYGVHDLDFQTYIRITRSDEEALNFFNELIAQGIYPTNGAIQKIYFSTDGINFKLISEEDA